MGNFKRLPNFFPKQASTRNFGRTQSPYTAAYRIENGDFVLSVRGINIETHSKETNSYNERQIPTIVDANANEYQYKINDKIHWLDRKGNLHYGKICHIWKDETGGIMSVQIHDEFHNIKTIAAPQIQGLLDANDKMMQQYNNDLLNMGIQANSSRLRINSI